MRLKTISMVATGAAAALVASLALAQANPQNTAYWLFGYGDAKHNIWRSGSYGGKAGVNDTLCWRAAYWTPAMAIAECDPDLVKRPAPMAAVTPPPGAPAARPSTPPGVPPAAPPGARPAQGMPGAPAAPGAAAAPPGAATTAAMPAAPGAPGAPMAPGAATAPAPMAAAPAAPAPMTTPAAPAPMAAPAAPPSMAAPAAPAAAAPAKPAAMPGVQKITLSSKALFDFDKSVLRPDGRAALDREIVDRMKDVQKLELVLVTGHADRIGTQTYNQRLSERRAATVRDYLVSKGVPNDKVETLGMGKTQPVPGVVCDQKGMKELIACLAPHRRVEVEVKGEAVKR